MAQKTLGGEMRSFRTKKRFDNKTKLLVSLLTIGAFFLVLLLFYFSPSLEWEIILPSATRNHRCFSARESKNSTQQCNRNVKTTHSVVGVIPLGLNKRFLTGHLRRQWPLCCDSKHWMYWAIALRGGAFRLASGLSSSELHTETQSASCHGESHPFILRPPIILRQMWSFGL